MQQAHGRDAWIGGQLKIEQGTLPHMSTGKRPAHDPQQLLPVTLKVRFFPAASLTQEMEQRSVELFENPRKDVPVVIAGHGVGWDTCVGQPENAPLERPGGLVESIVVVDDVAAKHDRIHRLSDSVADDRFPHSRR